MAMSSRGTQSSDRKWSRTGQGDRRVTITLEDEDDEQLDGDVMGRCHVMKAEIRPNALMVRVAT